MAQSSRPATSEAGSPAAARAWIERVGLENVVVGAGLLALAATLLASPYLPFQDIPNHLKILQLDAKLRASGPTEYLRSAPGVTLGYSLLVEAARLGGPLLGVPGVVRWLCILAAAAMPLSAIALARSLGDPWRKASGWAGVLALPVALSWSLRVGMLPYALGMPCVVLGLAAAVRAAREPGWKGAGRLAAVAVVCYLAHPYAYAWLAMLSAVAGLRLGARDRAVLVRVGVGAAAAIPLLAFDVLRHRLDMVEGAEVTLLKSPLWWRPWGTAAVQIVTRGLGITGPGDLIYYLPLLAIGSAAAYFALRDGPAPEERASRDILVAAALLGSVVTVAMPDSKDNVFILAGRATAFGVLFWMTVGAPAVPRADWLRYGAIASVAIAFGWQLREVRVRSSLVASVVGPRPSQVDGAYLPVQVPRCSIASSNGWGDYDPLRHAWAYALGPGAVAPYLFAGTRYQPVWFQPGVLRDRLYGPNEHLLTANDDHLDSSDCATLAHDRLVSAISWRGDYDGVLVVGRQPETSTQVRKADVKAKKQLGPGLLVAARRPAAAGIVVDFGTLEGASSIDSGCYSAEFIGGRTVQWSKGSSTVLRFPLAHVADLYELRVVARAPYLEAMDVEIGGFRSQIALDNTLVETTLRVPASAVHDGINEIRFRYPQTFTVDGDRDDTGKLRQLAVMFDEVALEPPRAPGESVTLDVGTPGARWALRAGFGPDEKAGKITSASIAEAEGVAELDLAGQASAYLLSIRARSSVAQPITVGFNGRWSVQVDAQPAWHDLHLYVPRDAVVPGANFVHLARDAAQGVPLSVDSVGIAPMPDAFRVDAGDPGAWSAFRRGFRADGAMALGLGASSEVDLLSGGEDEAYALDLRVRSATGAELPVTVRWGAGLETAIVVPAVLTDVSVAVPAGVVRPGSVALTLAYDGVRGEEDAAIALASIGLRAIGSAAHVALGTPAGRARLGAGWASDERVGDRTATWAIGPASELRVPWPTFSTRASRATVDLTITAIAAPGRAPLDTEVWIGGAKVGAVTLGAAWGAVSVQVPLGALRGGVNTVRLGFPALEGKGAQRAAAVGEVGIAYPR